MSKYDDEFEGDDFDSPEETDSVIRELRLEIVRLQAQIDQINASVREQSEESALLAARVAVLEEGLDRLRARQQRDAKIIIASALLGIASLALSIYTYLAS